ncbi:hypothetical protein RBA63_13185 [Brenneria goodwinii]|uniref:hypothetical protein n=1 Tax=Brenneria goodwinii TaxID=1109412 RepID=UPI00160098F9|nr:hypothetical protein [Brenneria goodwinii]
MEQAYPFIFQAAGVLALLLGPFMGLAPLSVTRITYWCKLIGTPSLAAFLHLEIYRA